VKKEIKEDKRRNCEQGISKVRPEATGATGDKEYRVSKGLRWKPVDPGEIQGIQVKKENTGGNRKPLVLTR